MPNCFKTAALEPLRNLQDFCSGQLHAEALEQREVKALLNVDLKNAAAAAKSLQLCLILRLVDGSPPGSSAHGIL